MLEVKIFWKLKNGKSWKMLNVEKCYKIKYKKDAKSCMIKVMSETYKFFHILGNWKPVTGVFLASWLKTILSLSGIDTKHFFLLIHIEVLYYPLHITKEYLSTIFLKAGDCTNADTFLNHYYAHASNAPVGQIILNESSIEG